MWLAAARACCVAVACTCAAAGPGPRVLKAAYGNSMPMVSQSPEGKPQGFAIDVFEEAARRARITLQWAFAGNIRGNNEALRRGEIDIIVTGADTAERRREFFVSSPWWAYELIALAPPASPVRSEADLPGRRLATPRISAAGVWDDFPGSKHVEVSNATEAVEAACRGEADAALVAEVHLRELLFAASKDCAGVSLSSIPTSARQNFVLVARREMAGAASELRRQVDEMALDGTLSRIAGRHSPISPPLATRAAEMLRQHQERLYRTFWMAGGAAALLLGGLFLFAQNRANRRLRKLNEKLKESDERWRFALENAGAGVWDWDAETNTTLYSRQCQLMLGFKAEEAADAREEWLGRIHEDDRSGAVARWERHLAGKTPMFAAEYRLRCQDGSYKWVLARGKVTSRRPDGRPLRCVGTLTDLTAIKAAEAEGERLHDLYLRAQAGTMAGNPCTAPESDS